MTMCSSSICIVRIFLALLLTFGGVYESAAASRYSIIFSVQPDTGAYTPYYGLVADASGNLFGVLTAGVGAVFKVTPEGTGTLLHFFNGKNDGAVMGSGLIMDSAGNMYGETIEGGLNTELGTIYRITPDGTETVLYSFTNDIGIWYPAGGLTFDSAGNLYGMTLEGGGTCYGDDYSGCGAVFELSPNGTLTILHYFKGGEKDGAYPSSNLIIDSAGNLYGATGGGGGNGCKKIGCGTVFKLGSDGKFTLLRHFNSERYQDPNQVIMDSNGNLWGTTRVGGNVQCGLHRETHCGSIFEIKKSGAFLVVHDFDGADGSGPSGLVLDKSGNFYGTTQAGGSGDLGTIFELTPAGALSTLYSFTGGANGTVPMGMVEDSSGNLFGETAYGGVGQNEDCDYGCGTLFEFTP
jgi:uncharacterized repeat protein (TIGR03803 family)